MSTMPRRAPRIIGYRRNGCPIWEVAGGAPTIDELILGIEVEREQATKRRDRATETVKVILAKARSAGRATLTAEEDAEVAGEFQKRERAKADLIGINSRYDSAVKIREMERENDVRMAETRTNPHTVDVSRPTQDREHRTGGARVVSEERTYHQGNDRKGGMFIRDVVRQFLYRDMEAETRLVRHMQEERVERARYLERAAGTGAFAGLTVPQYLTDMYAPAVAGLRPFADICNHHDLPETGMTVNISRITTPTAVGLQATENTAVTNQDIDDTLLTENVQTAAGQQTLSRQAIERATGVEEITMDDLFRRYATTLDSTLLNQAVTGLVAVSATQTYTDASPTSPEIYGQMIAGAAQVEGTLLGFAQPDVVVMHSRRWYKLLSAVSTSWPMIFTGNNIPVQAMGTDFTQTYGKGVRGILANGLSVVVDNNILTNYGAGTNQDQIYVVPSRECHLWEDPNAPVFLRAEQAAAASLGVLLVLYGYFAYTFRRFANATVKVDGTGLITPVYDGT